MKSDSKTPSNFPSSRGRSKRSTKSNPDKESLPIKEETWRGSESELKHSLRRFIRAQKKENTVAQLAAMSTEITNRVLALASWQEAGTLLLYYPLADEVDVRPLIKKAYDSGKKVLLPVVKGEELELRLYEGEASLKEGTFGIMEPTGPSFAPENYDEIQLAIIPGMAFDTAGHRLGRGKGYYDRLLPLLPRAYKIGICFPFQRVPGIPADEHDIKMDEVI